MRYMRVMLVAGCASAVWTKLGASDAEIQREWVACQAQSTQGSYDPWLGGRINSTTQRELMIMCLQGHGWTKLTKAEAEQRGIRPWSH